MDEFKPAKIYTNNQRALLNRVNIISACRCNIRDLHHNSKQQVPLLVSNLSPQIYIQIDTNDRHIDLGQ